MYVTDKFAGFPAVHPIARHATIQDTRKDACEKISATLPQSASLKFWDALKTGFKNWKQRRMDRQAFEHMIALDDPILKDIGVTRTDVIWASKLPLSQNAALELEKIARQNRSIR